MTNKFPVILTMTIKNEEHIIHRCLDSVLPYVDGVAIAIDSKTTDNSLIHSIDLVKKYNKPYKIELKEPKLISQFHEFDRVDMAFARNQSIELAEELIKEHFSDATKAYHLIMDADEALVFNSEDPFQQLDGIHNFNFLKKYPSGYNSYSGMQLYLAFNGYYWQDEIHEQVEQKPEYSHIDSLNIDTFYLDFQPNIGARGKDKNKVYKDIAVMKFILDNRPNYRKMQYYLALAYKEAGMQKEEAEVYKLMISNPNSFLQEKWYSYINLAFISPRETFIHYMLNAYELDKNRAEPLYHLIVFCLTEHMNDMAFKFGLMANNINKPEKGSFFLDESIYDWKIKDELSVAAYYVNQYETSYNLCDFLLKSNFLPEQHTERVKNNRRFAIRYVNNNAQKSSVAFYVNNEIE